MDSWNSYPKVYHMGHRAIESLYEDEVTVEEKIDGSQFSFGIFGGKLRYASRRVQLHEGEKDIGMFAKAVETVKTLAPILVDGWTYRGEYLEKPRHNTLCYGRAPNLNIIIYDIATGPDNYLSYDQKKVEASNLGLEVVPCLLKTSSVISLEVIKMMLEKDSVLGGVKIEGMVFKNHNRFGIDSKPLMGKFVGEDFKEANDKNWKQKSTNGKDILEVIGEKYRCKGRWQKAVQHLKEEGVLLGEPKDIGGLIKETQNDVDIECRDEIKDALYNWAKRNILARSTRGLAQWYKEKLVDG